MMHHMALDCAGLYDMVLMLVYMVCLHVTEVDVLKLQAGFIRGSPVHKEGHHLRMVSLHALLGCGQVGSTLMGPLQK